MHVILCLLITITFIRNGYANQFIQNHSNKKNLSSHSYDDVQKIRKIREVQDLKNYPLTELSESNLVQRLNEKRNLVGRPFLIQKHTNSGKVLKKRSLKKKHHRKRNQKRTKHRRLKKRKKGIKKRSRRKKGRNKMANYNSKKIMKIQRRHNPKKSRKSTKPKFKRFSPMKDIIDYLKSDQQPKFSGVSKNCQNSVNYRSKYCKNKKRQRTGTHSLDRHNEFNSQNYNNIEKLGILKNKNQIKRSPPDNLREEKSVDLPKNCEAKCQNQNFNSEPCICRNNNPIDFERQLKLLNKGGEEIEINYEKPGFFNGIQNFIKDSLKNERITTLNPQQCKKVSNSSFKNADIVIKNNSNLQSTINIRTTSDNFFYNTKQRFVETTSEAVPEIISEVTTGISNIVPEAVSEPINEITGEFINEATKEDTFQMTSQTFSDVTRETIKNAIFEDTSEAITKAISEAIDDATSQTNTETKSDTINKATDENCYNATNEDINESTDPVFKECTNEDIKEFTNEVIKESTDNINKITSEIFPEKSSEAIFETTNNRFSETSYSTSEINSGSTDSFKLITEEKNNLDCKDNMEIFDVIEDINSSTQIETSTLIGTENEMDASTLFSKLDNSPCLFTTSVSYDVNVLCNDRTETEDQLFEQNHRKPIATFSLEFKTNQKAKKKGFRLDMKY